MAVSILNGVNGFLVSATFLCGVRSSIDSQLKSRCIGGISKSKEQFVGFAVKGKSRLTISLQRVELHVAFGMLYPTGVTFLKNIRLFVQRFVRYWK